MLSNMESSPRPTAAEAAAALSDAEASRAALARADRHAVVVLHVDGRRHRRPDRHDRRRPRRRRRGPLAGPRALRGRRRRPARALPRLNGVWLGGFASRVVLGTGTAASLSYAVALGAAIWAAYGAQLVAGRPVVGRRRRRLRARRPPVDADLPRGARRARAGRVARVARPARVVAVAGLVVLGLDA